MSNEVVFIGRIKEVSYEPQVYSAAGEVTFGRYAVTIGETPTNGRPVEIELTTLNPDPGSHLMWAVVKVTVEFPEGWEVQA